MNIAHIRELGDHPDTQVLPLFKNDKLEEMLGKIARRYSLDQELLTADFKGKKNEVFSTYVKKRGGTHRLFLLGLGEEKLPVDSQGVRKFFHQNARQMGTSTTVLLNHVPARYHEVLAQVFVTGCMTGAYDLGLYKTDREEKE